MSQRFHSKLVLLSLISFTAVARAEVECSNKAFGARSIIDFPSEGYWMQAAGDCRMTYTSVGGTNTSMYNYCTKRSEPITNFYDGFPVPGFSDELYVHPRSDQGQGQAFFKFADASRTGGANSPIYQDTAHTGVYESIGLLSGGTEKKKVVRIAAGWSAGAFRDYEIKKDGANFQISPKGDITQVCKNLPSGGLDSQLPVLSRDGQMIAAREMNDSKSKIFRIRVPGGTCTEVGVIPQQTSKLSFSFDNKSVLYVIQDPNSNKGRLMAYDLDTKRERTISAPTEDVQYMTFKPDGTLMYTRRGTSGTELVGVDPNAVKEGADPKTEEALGLLWATKCNMDVDASYAGAIGRRLTQSNCSSLAAPAEVSQGLADSPYSSVTADKIRGLCASASRSAGGSSSSRDSAQ